jgi:hypothetical protein
VNIHKTVIVYHYGGRGIDFDSFEALAGTLRMLGHWHAQDGAAVSSFINELRTQLRSATVFTHDPEATFGTGLLSLPFEDLKIVVTAMPPNKDGQGTRYKLEVTDLLCWPAPTYNAPDNHTDTQLAFQLGQARPLERIVVDASCAYRAGTDVQFDVAALLTALESIAGLEPAIKTAFSARLVAQAYYERRQPIPTPSIAELPLVLVHDSSARLSLIGFDGIKWYDKYLNWQARLSGDVISGPLNPLYDGPSIQFCIDHGDGTSAKQLDDLADKLSDALRAIGS